MALDLTSISVVSRSEIERQKKTLEGLESLSHQEVKIMPQSLQEIKVTKSQLIVMLYNVTQSHSFFSLREVALCSNIISSSTKRL